MAFYELIAVLFYLKLIIVRGYIYEINFLIKCDNKLVLAKFQIMCLASTFRIYQKLSVNKNEAMGAIPPFFFSKTVLNYGHNQEIVLNKGGNKN